MFSWLFGTNNNILNDNIKTTSNYVLFTKLKDFEEKLEKLSVIVYRLEEENKYLKNEVKRLLKNDLYLNKSQSHIQNILTECIVLKPLEKD